MRPSTAAPEPAKDGPSDRRADEASGGRGLRHPDPSRARPVTWAWEDRIPIGRASLVVGNEGIGKGTFASWLAAQLSHGNLDGDLKGTSANVLIVGDEDALDDTWTPRLYAAGADWPHIFFPPDDAAELDVTTDEGCDQLAGWIKAHQIRVVFFDALLDHLGGQAVDEFKAKSVRNALRPLRRLARELEFAAVGSMHPRKGRVLSFRDLIANSHQFNAVSRSSLLLTEHPDDENRRALIRGKGNLANGVPALVFRIRSHVFELNGHTFNMPLATEWEDSELKIGDVLPGASLGGDGRVDRRDAVLEALTSTPQSERDVARAAGIPKTTVRRILHLLAADDEAEQTDDGWVVHVALYRNGPVDHPRENGGAERKPGGPQGGPHSKGGPPPQSAIFGYDDGGDPAS